MVANGRTSDKRHRIECIIILYFIFNRDQMSPTHNAPKKMTNSRMFTVDQNTATTKRASYDSPIDDQLLHAPFSTTIYMFFFFNTLHSREKNHYLDNDVNDVI